MSPESAPKGKIKVTDRRIFTADGEIREEFREDVESKGGEKPAPEAAGAAKDERAAKETRETGTPKAPSEMPSPFTAFVESLVVNAYMSLGLVRHPLQPDVRVDLHAARQMIDIISMLEEKTKGNLTKDEKEALEVHLSDLKLNYVRRTKAPQ